MYLHDDVVLVVGRRHGVIAVAVEEGVDSDSVVAVLLALHLGWRGGGRGRGHDLKIQWMLDVVTQSFWWGVSMNTEHGPTPYLLSVKYLIKSQNVIQEIERNYATARRQVALFLGGIHFNISTIKQKLQ